MKRIFSLLTPLLIVGLTLLGLVFYIDKARAKINAAIIVVPPEVPITDENGKTAYFTIQLDGKPSGDVDILITSDDISEGRITSNPPKFNQGNWKVPKQIEVTGWPDGEEDGDVIYHITGISSSDDPEFDGLIMPIVTLTNINDSIPVANDDNPPVDGYTPILVPVLDNDSALGDIPLHLSIANEPSYGDTQINPDNTITYTPISSFAGFDQFTYTVCDSDSVPDCDSADVILEDQIPPEILSVSPVQVGEIFEVSSEEITLEVEASDNFQVDCVNFIRWDDRIEQYIQLGDVCQPPYAITVDASTLNYGWNQVYFQVSDMAGNLSAHEFIWLYRVHRNYIPLVISP